MEIPNEFSTYGYMPKLDPALSIQKNHIEEDEEIVFVDAAINPGDLNKEAHIWNDAGQLSFQGPLVSGVNSQDRAGSSLGI